MVDPSKWATTPTQLVAHAAKAMKYKFCIERGKEIASSSLSPDRAPGEHFCSDLGRNLCNR